MGLTNKRSLKKSPVHMPIKSILMDSLMVTLILVKAPSLLHFILFFSNYFFLNQTISPEHLVSLIFQNNMRF